MKNGAFSYSVNGVTVKKVCPFDRELTENSIFYSKIWNSEIERKVVGSKNCILLLPSVAKDRVDDAITQKNEVQFSDNPRLAYAKLMLEIEEAQQHEPEFGSVGDVHPNAQVGVGTKLGQFVVVEDDATIGKNCLIGHGVKICSNTTIGDNVRIKCNTVVGHDGFGFEKDESGEMFRILQLGGVVIEDNVQIGALTTICSGAIEPTRIGKYSCIDDHVHIGHNVQIEESVIITACAEVCRSLIKKGSWVGPNASIIQGVTLGTNSYVGIGSVVTKTVNDGQIVAGNPAEDLTQLKSFRKKVKDWIKDDSSADQGEV